MVVVPIVKPDRIPEILILPTAVLLLLQVPAEPVVASVMVLPSQTEEGPETVPATGGANTVMTDVALLLPHAAVTV